VRHGTRKPTTGTENDVKQCCGRVAHDYYAWRHRKAFPNWSSITVIKVAMIMGHKECLALCNEEFVLSFAYIYNGPVRLRVPVDGGCVPRSPVEILHRTTYCIRRQQDGKAWWYSLHLSLLNCSPDGPCALCRVCSVGVSWRVASASSCSSSLVGCLQVI